MDLWAEEDENDDIWAGEEEEEEWYRTEDAENVFQQVDRETWQHEHTYTMPLQTPIDLPFPVLPHPYYFPHACQSTTTMRNSSLSDNPLHVAPHSQLTCLAPPHYPPYTYSFSHAHTVTPHIQPYRDTPYFQLQSDSLLPQLTPQCTTHMHTFATTHTQHTHPAPTHSEHSTHQSL